MVILVTGGAGFIGSHFIRHLFKAHSKIQVICLDALTYAGDMSRLEAYLGRSDFRFVKGDVSDSVLVNRLFEESRFDVVVNFAAESHVDRSIEDPSLFIKTNVLGTQVLLEASRKYGVKRFHQVSTDEVYGDLPLDRPDLLFTEDSPLRPSSPYSASKASADLLALSYHRTFHLPVTISRSSNNFGPDQFPEKLIPLMISKALKDQQLPLYGNGQNRRDWLYVEDHCRGIDLILQKGRAGEIYNLGGDNEKSNLEVVKMILRLLGKPESLIAFVPDRPGHDLRYAVDSTKAKKELGWGSVPLTRL